MTAPTVYRDWLGRGTDRAGGLAAVGPVFSAVTAEDHSPRGQGSRSAARHAASHCGLRAERALRASKQTPRASLSLNSRLACSAERELRDLLGTSWS